MEGGNKRRKVEKSGKYILWRRGRVKGGGKRERRRTKWKVGGGGGGRARRERNIGKKETGEEGDTSLQMSFPPMNNTKYIILSRDPRLYVHQCNIHALLPRVLHFSRVM